MGLGPARMMLVIPVGPGQVLPRTAAAHFLRDPDKTAESRDSPAVLPLLARSPAGGPAPGGGDVTI